MIYKFLNDMKKTPDKPSMIMTIIACKDSEWKIKYNHTGITAPHEIIQTSTLTKETLESIIDEEQFEMMIFTNHRFDMNDMSKLISTSEYVIGRGPTEIKKKLMDIYTKDFDGDKIEWKHKLVALTTNFK